MSNTECPTPKAEERPLRDRFVGFGVRSRASFLLVVAAALITGAAAEMSPLILAEEGSARAFILTPATPSTVEKYAAAHMAKYLSRMTGGTFEIAAEAGDGNLNTGRPVISVGRTTLAEGLSMQGPAWKRGNSEAFRIARRGNALVICGNQEGDACDAGTLWGVSTFLQMQGVGSYLGGEPLGEVVPAKPTLSIDALDLTDAPAFEMRGGDNTPVNLLRRYLPGGEREGDTPGFAFNRRAAARRVEFFHAFQYIATAEVRREHPEWFENTGNSPYGAPPGPSPHIGYGLSNNGICLTRPEIRNLFIEFFRKRFRDSPDRHGATISPDDYLLSDRCPCPNCQRLLDLGGPPSFADATGAPRSASDLLIDFVNAVAAGLEEEFPDRRLITLAYLDYLDPPRYTRVHPNVIIMPAPLCTRNELNPALDNMVRGWQRMGARKMYWYGYILTRPPIPHLMGEWFRRHKRLGIEGVYLEFARVPVMNLVNGWLYGKLTWDPEADVGELLDEYFTGLFGPGLGRVMRRFFLAAWEVNPPLYKEIPTLFAAAERMAGDPGSVLARRVRFFKLGWDLYYSSLELDEALKAGDIPAAHLIVKRGIATAETLKAEYPWAIRANVWLYNTAHMEYSATVLPALERLLNTRVVKPAPEALASGPVRCLTNNVDVPASERLDTAVTVSFSQPARRSDGTELFDGQLQGPGQALSPGSYPVWTISLDLQREYQIERVEICTGMATARWDIVPIHIEVQLGRDGGDVETVERILPRTLKGFAGAAGLFQTARHVRFRLASLNMWHAVSEIRVWGRPRTAD